jgi:hypothetical protein
MNDAMPEDDKARPPYMTSRALRYTEPESDMHRAYRKRYARRGWNHPIVTVLLALFVLGVAVVWVAWVL